MSVETAFNSRLKSPQQAYKYSYLSMQDHQDWPSEVTGPLQISLLKPANILNRSLLPFTRMSLARLRPVDGVVSVKTAEQAWAATRICALIIAVLWVPAATTTQLLASHASLLGAKRPSPSNLSLKAPSCTPTTLTVFGI